MRRQRKCKRNDARAQQFNNIHALDTLLIVSVHWYDQNLLRLGLRNNLQLQTIQLVFQGSQAAAQQIVYDSAILLCMKKTTTTTCAVMWEVWKSCNNAGSIN